MIDERRGDARHDILGGEMATLPFALSVRLLEISAGGVLLQSNQIAKVGSRGRLTLTLDGQPFTAEVEVRRVSTGVDNIGARIGVMFVDTSPEHQQMIERLVQPSASRPRD